MAKTHPNSSPLPTSIRRKIKKPLIAVNTFIIAFAVFLFFYIFWGLPSPYSLKDYKAIPLSTRILDRNGKLLYEIYNEQNRTPVKINTLPKYVVQASIAIEDKDFYTHQGVSVVGGIGRAIKDTIRTGHLQGGSTITQQLVKSALLTPERTIRRKIREIVLALWVERIFTKNEILELYLNQVPYGGSAYGIESGAKVYFGKKAADLTLDQAAFLAGLPQAPSLYSPYANPELAHNRRNLVLQNMKQLGFITPAQYSDALGKKIVVVPPGTKIKAPHFVFFVKQELERLYGVKQVEEGGLTVTTTLDLPLQGKAEKVVSQEIEDLAGYHVGNGAALVTRPPTGEILAMVGSVDYFASPSGSFNVTTALRQPGSSIKPLNYAIGIDRGIVTAASTFLDVKTCFAPAGQPKAYCPVNYDGAFHGPVQLRFALANSYNIPAVKMLALNGVDNFVASASAFGITSFKDPTNYGLSLTLGGGEVKMTEMATAFSAFANQGKSKKLNPILKIKDKNGKTLYEFKDPNFIPDIKKPLRQPNYLLIDGKRAISKETAFIISHILADNGARTAAFGPSSALVIPKHKVSVKTGTTDDKRDNWTVGYTPNFLTIVWVGNNDNSPMNPAITSGITGAAPIWNGIMSEALKNQPDLLVIKPATVIGRQVCSGFGASEKKPDGTDGCPTRFEYFIVGKTVIDNKSLKTGREQVAVTKDSDKLASPGQTDNIEVKEKTVLKDEFSTFCVDCAGDNPHPTPTP